MTCSTSHHDEYFLDKTYAYEAGALISSQSDENVMSIIPNFFVNYDGSDNVDINFTIINTEGIREKTSIGGYGTYPIQSRYSDSWTQTFPTDSTDNIESFSIPTEYKNAWKTFFTSKLKKAGLAIDDFEVAETEDGIQVKFIKDSPVLNVYITIKSVDVEVQIAPGWIE